MQPFDFIELSFDRKAWLFFLWELSLWTQIYTDTDLQLNAALMMDPTHFVILVSKHGRRGRWLRLIDHFEKQNIPYFCITSSASNPMTTKSCRTLHLAFSGNWGLPEEIEFYNDLFVLFNMVFWQLYPNHKERAKKLEQERKKLHK